MAEALPDDAPQSKDSLISPSLVREANYALKSASELIQKTKSNKFKTQPIKNDDNKHLDFIEAAALGEARPLKRENVETLLEFLFPNQKPLDGNDVTEKRLYLLDSDTNQYLSVLHKSNGEIYLKTCLQQEEFSGERAILTMLQIKNLWIAHKKKTPVIKTLNDAQSCQDTEPKCKKGRCFLANMLHEKVKTQDKINNVKDSLRKVRESTEFNHGNVLVFLQFLDTFSLVGIRPRIELIGEDANLLWMRKEYFKSFMPEEEYNCIKNVRNHIMKGNRKATLRPESFQDCLANTDITIKSFFDSLYQFTDAYCQRLEGQKDVVRYNSLPLRFIQQGCTEKPDADELPDDLLKHFSNKVTNLASAKDDKVSSSLTNDLIFNLVLNVYPRMEYVETRMKIKSRLTRLRNRLVHAPHKMDLHEFKENITFALPSIYKYSMALKLKRCFAEEKTISSMETKLNKILSEVNREFEEFKIKLDRIAGEGFNVVGNSSCDHVRISQSTKEDCNISQYLRFMAPILDTISEDNSYSSCPEDSSARAISGPAMKQILETFTEWEEEEDHLKKLEKIETIKRELVPFNENYDAIVTQISEDNHKPSSDYVKQVQEVLQALRSLRTKRELEGIGEISDDYLALLYERAIDSENQFHINDHYILLQRLPLLSDLQKGVIDTFMNSVRNSEALDTVELEFGKGHIPISIKSAVRHYLNIFMKEYKLFKLTFDSWDDLFSDQSFRNYVYCANLRINDDFLCDLQRSNSTPTGKLFFQKHAFCAALLAMHMGNDSEKSHSIDTGMWSEITKAILNKGSFDGVFTELLESRPQIISALAILFRNNDLSTGNIYTILKQVETKGVKRWLTEVKNGAQSDVQKKLLQLMKDTNDIANVVLMEHVLGGNLEHGIKFANAYEAGLKALLPLCKVEDGPPCKVEDDFQLSERLLWKAKVENTLALRDISEAHNLLNESERLKLIKSAKDHITKAKRVAGSVTEGRSKCHHILGLSRQAFSYFLLVRAACVSQDAVLSQVTTEDEKRKHADLISHHTKELISHHTEALKLHELALEKFITSETELKTSLAKSSECRKYVNLVSLRCAKARTQLSLLRLRMKDAEGSEDKHFENIIATWHEAYDKQAPAAKTCIEEMKLSATLTQMSSAHYWYVKYLEELPSRGSRERFRQIFYHALESLKYNVLAYEKLMKSKGIMVVLDKNNFSYLVNAQEKVEFLLYCNAQTPASWQECLRLI